MVLSQVTATFGNYSGIYTQSNRPRIMLRPLTWQGKETTNTLPVKWKRNSISPNNGKQRKEKRTNTLQQHPPVVNHPQTRTTFGAE